MTQLSTSNGEDDAVRRAVASIETPKDQINEINGYSYVTERYMRDMLNKYFPSWSWSPISGANTQVFGTEWIIVEGVLRVVFGNNIREYYSLGSSRITYRSGAEHTPDNIIDIDNNVATANAYAFKRAANRLCSIADDVYRDFELGLEERAEIIDLANKVGGETQSKILRSIENKKITRKNYSNVKSMLLKELED